MGFPYSDLALTKKSLVHSSDVLEADFFFILRGILNSDFQLLHQSFVHRNPGIKVFHPGNQRKITGRSQVVIAISF